MRRFATRRVALGAALAIAVLATAGWFATHQGSSAPTYRLASASLGTVTQTIPISGNLAAVSQSDLDFATAGRVAVVKVSPGQHVNPGDVLASLETAQLAGAVTSAQAGLQSAQARLSLDQAGATAQALSSAQASVSSATVQLQNAQTALADTVASNAQALAQAQAAVASDQATVDADQSVLDADRAKQQSDTNAMNSDCASNSSGSACNSDRQAVQADNQRVAADQQTLTRDQGILSGAQNALAATLVKNQQSYDQAMGQVNSARVALQNARAALAALQAGSTPQQLSIDESAVAVAQVALDTAQRNLGQATITAPVAGIVSAVNLVVGQNVSAGGGTSSAAAPATHAVSMLTPGAYQVTGSVSDSQVSQVATGQLARVIPAGTSEALTGKVTAVSPTATVTSGVATFSVTVTLDAGDLTVHAGASAAVNIIVNQVVHVLTVPTSAVKTTGAGTAVQVLSGGRPTLRPVTIGASDAVRTQVVSGLDDGDQVVVATVSRTVPTTTNGGGLFGPGGAPGGRGARGGG
ncbi:MAG: efflux RND transporter periplasmic adaptor subunit [Candidatus Dormibacteria bacterium]